MISMLLIEQTINGTQTEKPKEETFTTQAENVITQVKEGAKKVQFPLWLLISLFIAALFLIIYLLK